MSGPCNGSAQCISCHLGRGKQTWLESDIRPGRHYTIILDHPDMIDIERSRCAAGRYAVDMVSALKLAGIQRSDCNVIYAVACYPGMDLEFTRREAKKSDEGAFLITAGLTVDPVRNCLPRVIDDVQRAVEAGCSNFICMGDIAMHALIGGNASSDKLRGSAMKGRMMIFGERINIFFTIRPHRIFGEPIMRDVFRADMAKAKRFFTGTLNWKDPQIIIAENEALLEFGLALLQGSQFISYDVETNGIHPETSAIRCIGFSNEDVAVVIPLRRINGWPYKTAQSGSHWWSHVYKQIKPILDGEYGPLIGHNAGNFDRRMCEAEFGVTPKLKYDTILSHLLVDNEMPHRLGFLGSYYTDYTEAWKADNAATESETDEDLWTYNGKDCVVTARIVRRLHAEMTANEQGHLYPREAMLQALGARMTQIGIRVSEQARLDLMKDYSLKRAAAEDSLKKAFGKDFNPRSSAQLKKAFYTTLGLMPPAYSKATQEPSTNDDAIRKMMLTYKLDDSTYNVLQAARLYKKAQQLIQLNLSPMISANRSYMAGGKPEPGILDLQGICHPSYNRLPATGRYSSSEPNLQNINSIIRKMFEPRKGNVFVACDAEALEVRVIAEEAGAKHTIKVLSDPRGLDLHNETMDFVYGDGIWQLPGAPAKRNKKGSGDFKNSRGTIKNVRYAHNYGAGIRRIWDQATSAEDDEGNLLYRNLTVDMIEEIVVKLRELEPEIPEWWQTTYNTWRKQGYIADSIWGRKRKFRKKATLPGIVNHPIQAGGFHIIAEAMIEIFFGEQPWFATERVNKAPVDFSVLHYRTNRFGSPCGLVTQTHDSMMFEVPEEEAEAAVAAVSTVMTRVRKVGAILTYTCEAKVGNTWEAV